jgi:hypothetical protein
VLGIIQKLWRSCDGLSNIKICKSINQSIAGHKANTKRAFSTLPDYFSILEGSLGDENYYGNNIP